MVCVCLSVMLSFHVSYALCLALARPAGGGHWQGGIKLSLKINCRILFIDLNIHLWGCFYDKNTILFKLFTSILM